MSVRHTHEDCTVHDPCEVGDPSSCPMQSYRDKRARDKAGAWSPLELGRDSGGNRHFLVGRPVHCGTFLELQTIDYRSDDYGEYTVPLQWGLPVRYEARLSRTPPSAKLYASVGGHEFVASLGDWMRFRWPR